MSKPYKVKSVIQSLMQNTSRRYPTFAPGMTTTEYIQRYIDINNRTAYGEIRIKRNLSEWEYMHRPDVPAPMLDPSQPEVVCETIE